MGTGVRRANPNDGRGALALTGPHALAFALGMALINITIRCG